MPIYGLTDRGLAFPEIGRIRKGGEKTSETSPGKDLKYFRVVFDADEQESAARFEAAYGKQPTAINVVFPFNDLDRDFQQWLEAYTAGRMIAKSDGHSYLYKYDYAHKREVVKNGVNVDTGLPMRYDPLVPEYSYKSQRTGEVFQVFCKACTRIRVIVPELARPAYLLVLSTSTYDAANLAEQIAAIQEVTGGRIAGVPLVLKRVPRMVSCPNKDGTRARREKWLLNIEINPTWFEKKLLSYHRAAFSLVAGDTVVEPKMLPGGNIADAIDEPDEDETEEEHGETWSGEEPIDGEVIPVEATTPEPAKEAATEAQPQPELIQPAVEEKPARVVPAGKEDFTTYYNTALKVLKIPMAEAKNILQACENNPVDAMIAAYESKGL